MNQISFFEMFQEMKDRLETEKRQQGNAFTEMFDRLKVSKILIALISLRMQI